MPGALSVYLTSKSRGHFCSYVQALNYHKNTSNGLLSVKMFGIPDAVVMDREYEDVTEICIDSDIVTPEEV